MRCELLIRHIDNKVLVLGARRDGVDERKISRQSGADHDLGYRGFETATEHCGQITERRR